MPVSPFYGDGLRGSRFDHNSLPVVGMDASINGSSMVRFSELVTIPNTSEQKDFVFFLWRVGVFVGNQVHGESGPSLKHFRILSGEQNSSQFRVGCGVVAGVFGPFLDGRDILSDIQLCPEINIVRAVTSIVDSRHAVVDIDSPFSVNGDRPSDNWRGLVRPDPRALALAQRFSCKPGVDPSEDHEHEGKTGIDNGRDKRDLGNRIGFSVSGCILFAVGLMLLDKIWRRVYFDCSMNSNVGIGWITVCVIFKRLAVVFIAFGLMGRIVFSGCVAPKDWLYSKS
jgi:hypothetical protein